MLFLLFLLHFFKKVLEHLVVWIGTLVFWSGFFRLFLILNRLLGLRILWILLFLRRNLALLWWTFQIGGWLNCGFICLDSVHRDAPLDNGSANRQILSNVINSMLLLVVVDNFRLVSLNPGTVILYPLDDHRVDLSHSLLVQLHTLDELVRVFKEFAFRNSFAINFALFWIFLEFDLIWTSWLDFFLPLSPILFRI